MPFRVLVGPLPSPLSQTTKKLTRASESSNREYSDHAEEHHQDDDAGRAEGRDGCDPLDDLKDIVEELQKTLPKKAALNFVGFEVKNEHERDLKRLVRTTGGEYKDAKVEAK